MNDNGAVSSYVPSALNQYTTVGGNPLSYDGNFNQTGYGAQTTSFNAASQLISLVNPASGHSAQFVYDGMGRCLKRTIDGATKVIVYDGWKPIKEIESAGNSTWNIYGAGPDEILMHGDDYSFVRYHLDRMGNVAFLLDTGGTGVEKYTYDAFGQPTITDWSGSARSQSAYGNRFMFTGREFFPELGLYDYRHRFYHPGLGRFLQTDPMGLQTEGEKLTAGQKALFSPGGVAPEAFGSSEMNLFRYCGDDPVDASDPTGLIDREIDRGLDKLGVQASLNSLKEAKTDSIGRSQVVQEKDGQRSLGSQFGKGETSVEQKMLNGRLQPITTQKEQASADDGHKPVAVGHAHMDVTGKADPRFSGKDIDRARGSAKSPGIPVYKVNKSNPSIILRLTPQINYRDEPTIRQVSP